MKVSSKVPAPFHGRSLLDYLAERFTYLTAVQWQALIQQGRVTYQGQSAAPGTIIRQGHTVTCRLPDFESPPVNLNYHIIYEDPWLLGINKPANLRVHSGGKFVQANLIYHLRHRHQPTYPTAQLAHRLDADTSGVILLTRSKRYLPELQQQLAEKRMVKRYLALVHGQPQPERGRFSQPIARLPDTAVPRYGVEPEKGKAAETDYQILQPIGPDRALVELRPLTGRTHQLRVHLAAAGHPIFGDALYTMSDEQYLAWKRDNQPPLDQPVPPPRMALHCWQLRFIHPHTGQEQVIEATDVPL